MSQAPIKQIDTISANFYCFSSGVIQVVIKPYTRVDLPEAQKWIMQAVELSNGKSPVVLIDNSHPHTTTLKARRFLSETRSVKAVAGIAQNSMSAFLANLWIKTVPTVYPSKIFTNTDSAFEWLESYV